MKTIPTLTTGLTLLTLLAGCVVTSVYPYYTTRDVVFDPALVGAWSAPGSTNAENEHWEFSKTESQAYMLAIVDSGKRTEFDAHLFKLKGHLFLDVFPRERPDNALPLHYLLQVTRIEPTLEMNMLDHDWLGQLVERNPKAIRHLVVPGKPGETGGGDLVLTADTAELQKFILKHLKTEGAFGKAVEMNQWKP